MAKRKYMYMVPVRYVGTKPWEQYLNNGTSVIWSEDGVLGPMVAEFPQDKLEDLLTTYPGQFEVVGNLAYGGLNRAELDALHKERFGRAPLSRWSDQRVIAKLEEADESIETVVDDAAKEDVPVEVGPMADESFEDEAPFAVDAVEAPSEPDPTDEELLVFGEAVDEAVNAVDQTDSAYEAGADEP